ncbi:MAG: 4Fe-4S dicluster domain-containing protein [Anaerolineales bacterium]|nr:4Fe-4S dicluster domain-containing protein [Anaerolineales bacterium]
MLQIAGATGAAALVTSLVTSGPFSPEAVEGINRQSASHGQIGEHEWSMGINLATCIGCHYCVWSCQATNDVPEDDMRWNVGFPERTENGTDFFMTRPCMHCKDAPCVKVCPVGATWIREDGLVVMDYDRCIGCRYCQVACPYDARRFNWEVVKTENPYTPTWGSPEVERRARGVIEKCTFCIHRIDRALEQGLTPGVDRVATPACVNACPVGARVFGDLKDPTSPISQFLAQNDTFRLREDFGTEPNVHYVRPEKEA